LDFMISQGNTQNMKHNRNSSDSEFCRRILAFSSLASQNLRVCNNGVLVKRRFYEDTDEIGEQK
jgi:hypothetical protein